MLLILLLSLSGHSLLHRGCAFLNPPGGISGKDTPGYGKPAGEYTGGGGGPHRDPAGKRRTGSGSGDMALAAGNGSEEQIHGEVNALAIRP